MESESKIKHYHNIGFYINKLKNNEFFSLSRWGDGEFLCASNKKGYNCDGHNYYPELRDGLIKALKSDLPYYKATYPEDQNMIKNNLFLINKLLKDNNVKIEWYYARVLEDVLLRGDINPLANQLNKMNFIVVSEENKKNLPFLTDFIEIPKKNCFLKKEDIKQKIIEMFEKYDNPVFGLSASMTTNVIIDELYPIIGDKCWMIDFGSIWDPFVGVYSRSYHQNYKITTLLNKV